MINCHYFSVVIVVLSSAAFLGAEPICKVDGELFPHMNCSKFYQCDHSAPVIRPCSENLYFNPLTSNCDYPKNVPDCVCGMRLTPNVNCSTKAFTKPREIVTEPKSQPHPDCPPLKLVWLPYSCDETCYVLCDNGMATIKKCSPGNCFDPDPEKNSGCVACEP